MNDKSDLGSAQSFPGKSVYPFVKAGKHHLKTSWEILHWSTLTSFPAVLFLLPSLTIGSGNVTFLQLIKSKSS